MVRLREARWFDPLITRQRAVAAGAYESAIERVHAAVDALAALPLDVPEQRSVRRKRVALIAQARRDMGLARTLSDLTRVADRVLGDGIPRRSWFGATLECTVHVETEAATLHAIAALPGLAEVDAAVAREAIRAARGAFAGGWAGIKALRDVPKGMVGPKAAQLEEVGSTVRAAAQLLELVQARLDAPRMQRPATRPLAACLTLRELVAAVGERICAAIRGLAHVREGVLSALLRSASYKWLGTAWHFDACAAGALREPPLPAPQGLPGSERGSLPSNPETWN